LDAEDVLSALVLVDVSTSLRRCLLCCLIATCLRRHYILVQRLFNDVIVKYVDDVDKFWTLTLIVETVNNELVEEIQNFQSQDPAIAPLLNLLAYDITPDKNELRSLPLDSRNLWSQRPAIRSHGGILIRWYTTSGT